MTGFEMQQTRAISLGQRAKSLLFRVFGPQLIHRVRALVSKPQMEEVDLIYDYFLDEGSNCQRIMIDVGAHYGTSFGRFAASGWEIHAFEPDNHNRSVLQSRHSFRSNLTVNRVAVSDKSRRSAEFYTSKVSTGISGLSAFDPSHTRSQQVSLVTLAEYCDSHQIKNIDFLKIDTEGHDLLVLRGLDFDRVRPQVLVCEFEDRKTLKHGYSRFDMFNYLAGMGYEMAISEWHPIEAYGGRHRWKAFRTSMAETAEQSWGNIIAFNGEVPHALLARYAQRIAAN